jgi:acyl-coenzyme A thioesterase PaaI-like protein
MSDAAGNRAAAAVVPVSFQSRPWYLPGVRLSPRTVLRIISYWPPYLVSGIRVVEVADDLSSAKVSLRVRPWNRNYYGTHFGGSLYAMCDPFYVFLLLHQLGDDHIVWDRAAEIEFVKAVSEPVFATFTIDPTTADDIRRAALEEFSVEAELGTEIVTAADEVVARVRKILYVRRKDAKERFRQPSGG